MKVALIKPPNAGGVLGLDMMVMVEPLGLECLAGALEPDGHDCTIIDARIDGEAQAMAKTRGVRAADSGHPVQLHQRALPGAQGGAGGQEGSCPTRSSSSAATTRRATRSGSRSPASTPWRRATAKTSSRRWWTQWTAAPTCGKAPGLVLNTPAGQRHTGPPPDRHHLDEMPLPARHLIDHYVDHYYQQFKRPTALLETARGCPFKCNFCSVWKFHESTFRQKSADRVVQELSQIRAPNVFITDDIFWMDARRCTELGKAIKASGIRKSFWVQTRTDIVCKFPHLIEMWRDLGYLTVFLGIEKVDDAGLASVNKSNSAANNLRALEILKEMGVGYNCTMIVDPDWEREDFDRLKRWMDQTATYNAGFTVLTPLPGTDLWDEAKEDVATYDWRIYDLFHTVMPTKLPLDEFYKEVAGVWSWSRHVFFKNRGKARFYLKMALGVLTGTDQLEGAAQGLRHGPGAERPREFSRAPPRARGGRVERSGLAADRRRRLKNRGKARFYLELALGLATGKITWKALRKGFDMAGASLR